MYKQTQDLRCSDLEASEYHLSPLSHLQHCPHWPGHLPKAVRLTQSHVATAGLGTWGTESLLAASEMMPTKARAAQSRGCPAAPSCTGRVGSASTHRLASCIPSTINLK